MGNGVVINESPVWKTYSVGAVRLFWNFDEGCFYKFEEEIKKMTKYNYIVDRPYEMDQEGMEYGFALILGDAQEMRKEAVRQAKNAFKSGREQIYFAMTVVREVMAYVKAEGFMVLSGDADFRNGKDYVLDVIEERANCNVPLRYYLEFGLEHLSCGETLEYVEELMVNRYYANNYASKDAIIAYIYFTGVVGMIYGVNFQQMFEYFESLVPDEEVNTFNLYAERERKWCDEERYQYMSEKLEEKFRQWDEDKDIVQMDQNNIMTIFNKKFSKLDDEGMESLLTKISHVDLCYSLLGANEVIRKHMVELIPKDHRIYLMDNWMHIPFSRESVEKCIEAMDRVTKIG